MAKNQSLFTDLDPTVKALIESQRKGTMTIETKKGTLFIKDVLYVPGLDKNLLSVPQMMVNGYSLLFEGNNCAIFDSLKKKIASVQMQNKTFLIKWNCSSESSMMTKAEAITSLWHKRFGHCNIQNLKLLHCCERN